MALLVIAPAARPRTAAVLPHHYYSSPTAQHCRRESEGWCFVCSISRLWHARAMQTDTHTIPRKPASDHQPPPPHMPFLMAADGHSHRIQQPAGQVVICEPPTPTLSKKAGGAWWRARHSQGATWFDSHRLLLSPLHFLCNKATREKGHCTQPKSWPTRGQCSATHSPDREAQLAPLLPPTPTPRTVVGTWL